MVKENVVYSNLRMDVKAKLLNIFALKTEKEICDILEGIRPDHRFYACQKFPSQKKKIPFMAGN